MTDQTLDQRLDEIAQRLVRQDVCYCVSTLVSTLAAREWDGSDGVDPDALQNLFYRRPDADDYREEAREKGVFDCPPGSPRADGRLIDVAKSEADGVWFFTVTDADGDEIDYHESYDGTEAGAWRAAFDSIEIDHPDGTECLEHWIVTDWLADKLEAQGEAIARDIAGLTIWGRCTSGQAIYADGVFRRLARAIDEA